MPDPTPANEKKSWIGSPSEMLYKAIVPLLCSVATLIGTVVVFVMGNREPHLSFKVEDTVGFKSDKNQFSISKFSVINDGRKEAENVKCNFDMDDIKDIYTEPFELHAEVKQTGNHVEIIVPAMNPGAVINVSIYSNHIGAAQGKIDVKVSAKSVTGVPQKAPTVISLGDILSVITLIALIPMYIIMKRDIANHKLLIYEYQTRLRLAGKGA